MSNRLPITIKRADDGSYNFSMSSGGLVSGLSGLSKATKFQWYGWPGLEVPKKDIDLVTKRLQDEHGAVPVFIADDLADKHYNGFSSMCCLPCAVVINPPTLPRCKTTLCMTIPPLLSLLMIPACFISNRFDAVASFPLSPWRDRVRGVDVAGLS